jgi:hypothetical protein
MPRGLFTGLGTSRFVGDSRRAAMKGGPFLERIGLPHSTQEKRTADEGYSGRSVEVQASYG